MAKQTAKTKVTPLTLLDELEAKLAELRNALGGPAEADADEAPEAAEPKKVPTVKELKALDDEEVLEAAKELGVKAKKAATARALLTTAALIVAGKPIDDDDDVSALATAVGLEPSDDAEEGVEALKAYFSGEAAEAEASEESEDDDDDNKSEESEESEGDDDDEKAEADDEEVSEADQLKAYNKSPLGKKKPLKKYSELKALLTDNNDEVAAWGTPYSRGEGEDEEAWCCGQPLAEVEDHEGYGKCAVSGKFFKQNRKGELVECPDPTE